MSHVQLVGIRQATQYVNHVLVEQYQEKWEQHNVQSVAVVMKRMTNAHNV